VHVAVQLSRLAETGGSGANAAVQIRRLRPQDMLRLKLKLKLDTKSEAEGSFGFVLTVSPSESAFVPHSAMCVLVVCAEAAHAAASEDAVVCAGARDATIFASGVVQSPVDARAESPDGGSNAAATARAETLCWERVAAAKAAGWPAFKSSHIAEFSRHMSRTSLRLHRRSGGSIGGGVEGVVDQANMLFDFSRYLLLSAGTASVLNLQGVWADGRHAAWSGDYHLNINLQMAYWAADGAGLGLQVLPPLTKWLSQLRDQGAAAARRLYQCPGWVAHGYVDGYLDAGILGDAHWNLCPTCGAWAALALWEHISHTSTSSPSAKAALAELLASFSALTDFFSCYLVEKKGLLHSGPSTSPENSFVLLAPTGDKPAPKPPLKFVQMAMTPALDASVLRNVAAAYSLAAQQAQEPYEQEEHSNKAKQLSQMVARLPGAGLPVVHEETGLVQEYPAPFGMAAGPAHGAILENIDAGHRHFSALHWLYPGSSMPDSTGRGCLSEELHAAARKTLQLKRAAHGGHTGWSAAWEASLAARLRNGTGVWEALQRLQTRYLTPRLLGLHPRLQPHPQQHCVTCFTEVLGLSGQPAPARRVGRGTRGMYTADGSTFQIDANMGWLAAALEALVQSHELGRLALLPALPPLWQARGGVALGLRARGDVLVSLSWERSSSSEAGEVDVAALLGAQSEHPWLQRAASSAGRVLEVTLQAAQQLRFVQAQGEGEGEGGGATAADCAAAVEGDGGGLRVLLSRYPCWVQVCSVGLSERGCRARLQQLQLQLQGLGE